MANQLTKAEMVFFEDVLEAFDPNNVISRSVNHYSPPMDVMERSGLTVRRPIEMQAEVTTGLDVSTHYKDIVELTVPSSLTESDIRNHAFKLNAIELNNPTSRTRQARAASRALAANIDKAVSDKITTHGTLVSTETGAFSDYEQLAKGETQLMEREWNLSYDRTLALAPRMALKMAGALAKREGDLARDVDAYEKSQLPMVANFSTVRANVLTALTGAANPTVTIGAANQRHTPKVFGVDAGDADNRYMALTVVGTGMANGDAFTIAGVNAVSMVSKKDTGQLQTFRVISGGGTTSLVISPAIIPLDYAGTGGTKFAKYANVTTTPANGAALTRLNTVTTQPSIFWVNRAVELIHGRLAMGEMGPNVAYTRERTDSGIEIIFAREGNIDDLSTKYRLTCWAAPNVLIPEGAGIYLPNQTAAFG